MSDLKTARRAALFVCATARTTDDAKQMLTALGLVEDGQLVMPTPLGLTLHEHVPVKGVVISGVREKR